MENIEESNQKGLKKKNSAENESEEQNKLKEATSDLFYSSC